MSNSRSVPFITTETAATIVMVDERTLSVAVGNNNPVIVNRIPYSVRASVELSDNGTWGVKWFSLDRLKANLTEDGEVREYVRDWDKAPTQAAQSDIYREVLSLTSWATGALREAGRGAKLQQNLVRAREAAERAQREYRTAVKAFDDWDAGFETLTETPEGSDA